MPSSFFNPTCVFTSAILLRVILLFYGLLQDKYYPLPYTDIDYFVFTDAARYVSHGYSPYNRETYRYTPLLAWLLVPTAWPGRTWFSFGKVLFALADIVAGWLIVLMLKSLAGGNMGTERALKFASIWLLNPMVATISTRGSSEGLLGVMVVALLWAVSSRRIALAGVLLGLAVHFKIYPFIYGISIVWYLEPSPDDSTRETVSSAKDSSPTPFLQQLKAFITPNRLILLMSSLTTFSALNIIMYAIYSTPFLTHTFLHHLTRIDHRHNFSPYNTLLYLSSASPRETGLRFESLAFLPQLALSAIFIPLALAKKDLAGTMLAQTFAFVAFNKVCTSQVRKKPYSTLLICRFNLFSYQRSDFSMVMHLFHFAVYIVIGPFLSTYGHRLKNIRHPVRSAKDKFQIGQLVVGSVMTSEYWLSYVFAIFLPGGRRGAKTTAAIICPTIFSL